MISFLPSPYRWLWPIALFLLLTPWSASVDLAFERFFYSPTPPHFASNAFYTFIFDWGPWPALAIGWAAALVLLISYFRQSWSSVRGPCAMLVLTLLIGGGLITHVLLKDHWGRPRPRQVVTFGGIQTFRPYYKPNFWSQPEPSKSFPCGHCTTGFFFFAVGLMGQRLRSHWLYLGGFAFAWLLGGALGMTRMAQGGHFFSDIVASALIMWETALMVEWLVKRCQRVTLCTG